MTKVLIGADFSLTPVLRPELFRLNNYRALAQYINYSGLNKKLL